VLVVSLSVKELPLSKEKLFFQHEWLLLFFFSGLSVFVAELFYFKRGVCRLFFKAE
jgi:hypothetical protein